MYTSWSLFQCILASFCSKWLMSCKQIFYRWISGQKKIVKRARLSVHPGFLLGRRWGPLGRHLDATSEKLDSAVASDVHVAKFAGLKENPPLLLFQDLQTSISPTLAPPKENGSRGTGTPMLTPICFDTLLANNYQGTNDLYHGSAESLREPIRMLSHRRVHAGSIAVRISVLKGNRLLRFS